jgi:CheY-like chemotaxis protein
VKHLTAVCVDDSRMELDYIERILADQGIRVVAKETDGISGLSAIRRFRPSFAVLDLQLPQMNGLDIARIVKAESLPTMLFVASGSAQKAIKEQAYAHGVKLFLSKPYDDLMSWNELKPFLETI